MKTAATDDDVRDVEAWAAVIADLFRLVPVEQRAAVLALAVKNEEAERRDRFKPINIDDISLDCERREPNTIPPRALNTIFRLEALVIQVFVRNIVADSSPEDAAAILFARQPHGHGSGFLTDYLDGLPRHTGVTTDDR